MSSTMSKHVVHVSSGAITCDWCGNPPKGVTIWPDMDEWQCPYCGLLNNIES